MIDSGRKALCALRELSMSTVFHLYVRDHDGEFIHDLFIKNLVLPGMFQEFAILFSSNNKDCIFACSYRSGPFWDHSANGMF